MTESGILVEQCSGYVGVSCKCKTTIHKNSTTGKKQRIDLTNEHMEKVIPYNFTELRKEINDSVAEHKKYGGWDGFIYNSTTILAIVMTSLAALLPIDIFYLKIISGIAAMLIAIDRTLNWGARWIYHRQMRHEYLIILAKISFYENMPQNFTDEEKKLIIWKSILSYITLEEKRFQCQE